MLRVLSRRKRKRLAGRPCLSAALPGHRLPVESLEDRRMLANIVTIGDSWAWLIAANGPGSAPPAPGFTNSFQQMLDVFHPGTTVYNESFAGGLAAQHVLQLNDITSRINAHPDADIVWLSSGGNDIVGGIAVGGYHTSNSASYNAFLKSRIVNDVTTIANHILSIRPDIQVVIEGYDYINIWDVFNPVSAGDALRAGFYGIVRFDTGFPAFDLAQNLQQNADFNAFMRDVEIGGGSGKSTIGENSRRIHHINNFGLHTSVAGYSGFLGNQAGQGFFPPDQHPDYPTDADFMNTTDPIHLNSTGYLGLSLRAQSDFFASALQNAVLSTNTSTLDFGNVRAGTTSGTQSVVASNVGPNFTKVQNTAFPAATGEFVGGGSTHNPLFMDPTLGSDTATSAPYSFAPPDRGFESVGLLVGSDSGSQTLNLSGTGVGPVYASAASVDFGTVSQGSTPSLPLDVMNTTSDGDLGALTDLTLTGATISGPDAGDFSLVGFTPGTVISASGTLPLSVMFDATGAAGPRSATLTFTTDVGAALGGSGQSFQVTLTGEVEQTVPQADAGGPYAGDENSVIVLDASSSTGTIDTYEWDLDNNGSYETNTGAVPTVNFSQPDNGVFTVGLRVTGPGGSTTDTATVTVNNVAPTASIAGTTDIYRGETVTFTLTATDPSPVDQAANFTFEIDWDGDSIVDENVVGPSGSTAQHTFSSVANTNIQVRATDKDASTGGFSATPYTVNPFVLRGDGGGNTDLIYGGTELLDGVFFFGSQSNLTVFTQFEGLALVNRFDNVGAAVTGKVIVHGYGFDDVLAAEFLLGVPIEIHGGAGNDIMVGGTAGDLIFGDEGHDLLLGGDGFTDADDTLFGGIGNDVLFGHFGADQLFGEAGEDLLLGDQFTFSNLSQGFLRIHQEWISPKPYATRVANILTGGGLNDPYTLTPGATVIDDGAVDTLTGGAGDLDWFFYTFAQDFVADPEVDEEETDAAP